MSRIFNHLTRKLFSIDATDTQCGLKMFNKKFANVLLEKGNFLGFEFDVEFFILARIYNIRAKSYPIRWDSSSSSCKINVAKLSLNLGLPMALNLFRLKIIYMFKKHAQQIEKF